MTITKESELYEPVKSYLESCGYDVKGEVKNCDITALKGEELIIVELKRGFTVDLIFQAIKRQSIADSVYVAVPMLKAGYMSQRYRDVVSLCRRLELGLIFVGYTSDGVAQIDVAVNPDEAKKIRRNLKKRFDVITEHEGRTGSENTGGVTRKRILTVYKEQAVKIAYVLNLKGPLYVSEIKQLTGFEKTASILGKNFYKWYEKLEDGKGTKKKYMVTQTGIEAINLYKGILDGALDSLYREK